MTGLHEVAGLGLAGHGRLNGAGAVGRRDAGRHAFGRLNGDRESGGMLGAVAADHGRQLQQLAALAGERQANQATAKARHEIDGLGRDVVGGQHQIALVFTVFFVNQDDHAAGGHLGHDLLHGGNGHGWQGGGGVHAVLGSVLSWSMRST